MTSFKLNADQSAVVATDIYWNYDMRQCPRGPKVQLLVKDGNAVYGHYAGQDYFEAWGPMLKRKPKASDTAPRPGSLDELGGLDAFGLTAQDWEDLQTLGRLTVEDIGYLAQGGEQAWTNCPLTAEDISSLVFGNEE